ncbi:hypothetical protein LTR92_011814, partial [Exophiala xenobiotica]
DGFVIYSSMSIKEKIENRRTGKPRTSSEVPERSAVVPSASSQGHCPHSGAVEVSDTDQASPAFLDGIEKGELDSVQPSPYFKASVNDVQVLGCDEEGGSVDSAPGR